LEADIDIGGLEQPLVLAQPKWDESTWAGEVPLVYIGDRSGRSVFVHTNGTIGFLDRLLAAGDIGDHFCMTIGDTTSPVGGADSVPAPRVPTEGRFTTIRRALPSRAGGPPGSTYPTEPPWSPCLSPEKPLPGSGPVGQTAFFDGMEPPTGRVDMTAIAWAAKNSQGSLFPSRCS
jgi:hypothetical protein